MSDCPDDPASLPADAFRDYLFCWHPGGKAVDATAEWGEEMSAKAVSAIIDIIRQKTEPPGTSAQTE